MLKVKDKPKPLVRWNIGGNVSKLGYDILKESVITSKKVFDKYNCEYVICYNQLSKSQFLEINDLRMQGISLRECFWEECPIPFQANLSPRNENGTFSDNTSHIGGTLWKITPPRLDFNRHEIIMDNDIVIFNDFPELSEFFNSSKTLICANNARFYGRYEKYFKDDECFNAGFTGVPPGFDYEQALYKMWDAYGRLKDLTYPDEQALSLLSLRDEDHIIVKRGTELELFIWGELVRAWPDQQWISYCFKGDEKILHFVQANRYTEEEHQGWKEYCKFTSETKKRPVLL